ncbi:MAG: DUF4238 domain-containing protein [Paludibacter sp.]|nr:DUF4238 domain-containing protein [Paludibacter sp.]
MSKKRHHYIPEVLCKRFTKDWKHIYRLDYSDLKEGAKSMSIKDAFVQKDLNTINLAGVKNSDFIEDFLNELFESRFAKSINKIFLILFEKAKDKIFEQEDYDNILNFCILSHLRTPMQLRHIHVQTLRRSYLFSVFAKPNDKLPLIDKDYVLTKTLFDGVNMIKKYLYGITLRIAYHTFDDEYFLLADQPIALVNSNGNEFASPDLEIILPISTNVVVIFSKTEKSSDITHIQKRETIETINKQLCENFNKYIACADKKYLDNFVLRNNLSPETIPDIKDIEAEESKIIDDIKNELKKNPNNRYISITKDGIEFLN